MTANQPTLAQQAHAAAVRMADEWPTMARPTLEQFVHLDAAPVPSAPADGGSTSTSTTPPPSGPVSEDAVRAALQRMQAEAKVPSTPPQQQEQEQQTRPGPSSASTAVWMQ